MFLKEWKVSVSREKKKDDGGGGGGGGGASVKANKERTNLGEWGC